jgi:CheY-specific phosphatase CheX
MQLLEEKYADGVIQAATAVFETMIPMPMAGSESCSPAAALPDDEVIGIMGFTGTRPGVIALGGSRELAVAICASMLGTAKSQVRSDLEVADSFGELVNMIAGNFKNVWVADGKEMDLALPSVVFGVDVSMSSGRNCRAAYACKMKFDEGDLHIDLRFYD